MGGIGGKFGKVKKKGEGKMSKTTTLTILCDNTAAMKEGIRAEHGFSVLLERGATRILFDTGQSDVFWQNAEVLGKDLTRMDAVVLSHGHYDHTGGLLRLAQSSFRGPVLAHEDVFVSRYKEEEGKPLKYIGCPYSRAHLESRGLFFRFVGPYEEVAQDVFFISGVPATNDFETGDPRLVVKDEKGRIRPDPFHDDAALYVRTQEGIIVILGCSHRGAINILTQILTLEGDVPILLIIGGMHLARVGSEQVVQTIKTLEALAPRMIAVSHCTGQEAAEAMRQRFGDRFQRAMAGVMLTVEEKGGVIVR